MASSRWTRELALSFACTFAYYADYFLRGLTLTGFDVALNYIPVMGFNADAIAHGSFPLWNPNNYLGVPHYANVQMATFLPTGYLALLWSPATAYLVAVAMLQGFLLFFTFRLFRDGFHLAPLPSALGALMFTFSGFVMNKVTLYNLLSGIPSTMAALYCGVMLHQTGRRRFLAGAAIALGLLFMTGPPIAVYGTYLYLVLVVACAFGATRSWRSRAFALVPLPVAILIASPQLVATWELLSFTRRGGGLTFEESGLWSLAPELIPRVFLPDPGVASLEGEDVACLPIAALCLTSLLPVFWKTLSGMQRRWALCLLGVALVGLVLAFGVHVPGTHWVAYNVIPGLRFLRIPSRWLLWCTFGLCGLAAVGLNTLLITMTTRWSGRDPLRAVLWVGALLVAILVVGIPLRERQHILWFVFGYGVAIALVPRWAPNRLFAQSLLVALLVFEIVLVARGGIVGDYSIGGSVAVYEPSPVHRAFERPAHAPSPRVAVVDDALLREQLTRSDGVMQFEREWDRETALHALVQEPHLNLRWGVAALKGNDGDLGALTGFSQGLARLGALSDLQHLPTLRFLGVEYVEMPDAMWRGWQAAGGAGLTHKIEKGPVVIARVDDACARAWWLPQIVPNVGQNGLDHASIDRYLDVATCLEAHAPTHNQLRLRARDGVIQPGAVFLTQSYYPGWTTSAGTLWNAHEGALTAVQIDAPVAEVVLRFRPWHLKWTLGTSIFTLLGLLLWARPPALG